MDETTLHYNGALISSYFFTQVYKLNVFSFSSGPETIQTAFTLRPQTPLPYEVSVIRVWVNKTGQTKAHLLIICLLPRKCLKWKFEFINIKICASSSLYGFFFSGEVCGVYSLCVLLNLRITNTDNPASTTCLTDLSWYLIYRYTCCVKGFSMGFFFQDFFFCV